MIKFSDQLSQIIGI